MVATLEPTVPVLAAGVARGACPACLEIDWWERPDGSALCGHCVRHTALHGPSSSGDLRWCPQCCANYWRALEARLQAAARVEPDQGELEDLA